MGSSITGVEEIKSVLGDWSPSDLAYIEEIKLWSRLGMATRMDVLAIFQSRQTSAGWPDLDGKLFRVQIRFEGVLDLALSGFGGGPVQVMGFDIHSVADRGWSEVRFEVEDYENGTISFNCFAIEVLDIQPYEEHHDVEFAE